MLQSHQFWGFFTFLTDLAYCAALGSSWELKKHKFLTIVEDWDVEKSGKCSDHYLRMKSVEKEVNVVICINFIFNSVMLTPLYILCKFQTIFEACYFYISGILVGIQTGLLKGHLISKPIYDLLTSPKKRTDEFDLFAFLLFMANKSNSSVCFFGESTARQSAFWN